MADNIDLKDTEKIDTQELMSEFDRESNTKKFEGVPKLLVRIFLVGFTFYVLWMTLFATPPEQVRRASFIGLLVFISFILYPARKNSPKKVNHVPWYDFVGGILGGASFFYFVINFEEIVNRATMITTFDMIAVSYTHLHLVVGTYKRICNLKGKNFFACASGGGIGRTLGPDETSAGPASYGLVDSISLSLIHI